MPPPPERWSLALCPMALLGVLAAKTPSGGGGGRGGLSTRAMWKDSPEWGQKGFILVTLKPLL